MADWKDPFAYMCGIQVIVSSLFPFEAKNEQGEMETIHAMQMLDMSGRPTLVVSQAVYDELATKATIPVLPPEEPESEPKSESESEPSGA
jgi:hypothetical protein